MSTKWTSGEFLRATATGPMPTSGYIYAGLGLHFNRPTWVVTHLGTGHMLCGINLARFAAEIIATEIAECGDWDWSGLEGYRNKDPGIRERVVFILSRYKPDVFGTTRDHRGKRLSSSEVVAREIAEANA